MRLGLSIVAGMALLAGSASAATPGSGQVSSASPRAEWTGTTTASWLFGAFDGPCEQPGCDSFSLAVGEPGDLVIGLGARPGTRLSARVRQPGGVASRFAERTGPDGFARFAFKRAVPGRWAIEYTGEESRYKGFAELATGLAPAPAPTAGAPPAILEALGLEVSVRRASARRLARSRRLRVGIDVSRPAAVSATLKARGKVVGRGRSRGSGPLTVKLTGPAGKGVYALFVVATAGRTSAARIVKVKVVR